MPSFPEVWGAVFFLVNKIFFSAKEHVRGEEKKNYLSIWSWSMYLIGLPAVVWLLAHKHDWMATAVEAGGAPSMTLGLIRAITKARDKDPLRLKGLEKPLRVLSYIVTVVGIAYSVYYYGGLENLTQWCELVMSIGFLIGTLQLAEEKRSGYLWYVPMHIATATLFWLQGGSVFVLCQIASVGFIVDAYLVRRRRDREKANTVSGP